MTSAMPPALGPRFFCRQRTIPFLVCRANLRDKWTNINHAGTCARFSVLTYHSPASLRSLLSIRSGSLLSCPSFRFVFKPSSPSLRSPLTSMTTPQATADPPSQSSSTTTVRLVIKGRVQGVFYRDWTVENATQLGLKGWVRNRRDGYVEALFSGDSDKVQEMEQRCRRGPPHAMVTGLQVLPCNDDPGTGFVRKPTA